LSHRSNPARGIIFVGVERMPDDILPLIAASSSESEYLAKNLQIRCISAFHFRRFVA